MMCGPVPSAVQLEQDVRESLLSMAKQSGKVDPDVSISRPQFIPFIGIWKEVEFSVPVLGSR